MNYVTVIRATAGLSDYLYRKAPPVYTALYEAYKRVSERANIRLMQRLVQPGDCVADIGANIGFYATVLGASVGSSGQVYAFEPDATNYERMIARVKGLPQVHPIHAAVTDHEGFVDLYLSPDINVDHRTYNSEEARSTVRVKAVSLDSFLNDDARALHFVKMDIQGAEYPALRGMESTVARSPGLKILMELTPNLYERFGSGTRDLIALVESWGFEIHRITNDGARLGERLTAATRIPECEIPDACFDVLCARPGTVRI